MLKLSTKGRYGTRLMLELALNYGREPILLKEAAKRQEMSVGYLEHLVPVLKTAGLINSARGAHGGYSLSKPPSEITLKEIVCALEGNMSVVECVGTPGVCNRVNTCVTRDIWEEISEKIKDILHATTLEDMVKRQKEKLKSTSLTYTI